MPASAIAEPPKPAPTPTPSPAPAPSPAPSPSPAPAPKPSTVHDDFDDKFAHLDADPAPTPKPAAPSPKPAAKAEPAKPDVGPKAGEPKKEPAAEPEKDAQDTDAEPPAVAKPSELRSYAKRMGDMAKNATKENKALRARLSELEAQPKQNGHDSAALAEQLAAANKRIEEYEHNLRLTKYERSEHYKDNYEKPYAEALKNAYSDVEELPVIVREPNPEDPERPLQSERAATKADFNSILDLNLGNAIKRAKELFGDAWSPVIEHYKDINRIKKSAYAAMDEYKAKGSEHEKQQEARTKQEQEFAMVVYDKAMKSMKTKHAEFLDERPDDTEGNDLLHKGEEFANLAFDGDQLGAYPIQQQAMIHARVAAWAGAFPRMRRDITALKAQLAEAQATIDELRGSGPGKPAPTTEPTPTAPKDLMSAFDEAIK